MTNLLLTGASGYIGGTLLSHLVNEFPSEGLKVFALVRTPAQAESVAVLGAQPLNPNFDDEEQLKNVVIENSITIVIETVDARRFAPAKALIEGLAAVKQKLGVEVHFFHTSGAKFFSSHTGIDSNNVLSDTESGLYDIVKAQKSPHPAMQQFLPTNIMILDMADSLDVKSYIIAPPMVYGPGEGFGNKISIQFVAIVRIGKKLGKVFQIDDEDTTWPFIHVRDLSSLYLTILREIVRGRQPPCGKAHGFYFAENGVFSWRDISRRIAQRLASHGLVHDTTLQIPSEADLIRIGEVLGRPTSFIPVEIAGSCALRGENGRVLGWKPSFGLDHLQESAGEEVDFILRHDSR